MWWISLVVFLIMWFLTRPNDNVKYYTIHLPQRRDRFQYIQETQKQLDRSIRIFKASGPQKIVGFLPGEAGCYTSHLRILNYVSKHPGYSVIFEDDVQISKEFRKTVDQVIRDIPDFDIIYLGNLDSNHDKHVKGTVYTVDSNSYLTGMHAYLIKNENVWKITSQLKYQKAIDLELPDLINEGRVQGFVLWPSLAKQRGSPSSIRNGDERVTHL